MPIDKELLDILWCLKCNGDLLYDQEKEGLICQACRVMYPIRDDIAVMLIEEAIPLNDQ
jgi:hypothetical protein